MNNIPLGNPFCCTCYGEGLPPLFMFSQCHYSGLGYFGDGSRFPIDNLIFNKAFAWLADWYALRNLLEIKTAYPRPAILVTAICALTLNGLVGPIVEELYFRGHLLPRLPRFGRWAPLLNVTLFSLYHFWTPWQFFSRVVLLLPMVYVVGWKRNIYLGMIAHCLLNLIGTTVLFAQLLG